jgi:hypothetical protein
MLKFMITFNYSNASWARMLAVADDRASAVAALVETLGGNNRCHQDGWLQGRPGA